MNPWRKSDVKKKVYVTMFSFTTLPSLGLMNIRSWSLRTVWRASGYVIEINAYLLAQGQGCRCGDPTTHSNYFWRLKMHIWHYLCNFTFNLYALAWIDWIIYISFRFNFSSLIVDLHNNNFFKYNNRIAYKKSLFKCF